MSDHDSLAIQHKLLGRIKNLIPANLTMVDVLSDLLEISTDSIYRRIRGETSLNIDEVSRICTHFQISFDELNTVDTASSVTFTFHPLSTVTDYKSYLQQIHDDMVKIAASEQNHITWAAEDVPIFHHFRFPFLAAFKVYYWFHCVIHTEEHKDKKFDPGSIDEEIKALCRGIYNLYARIPSTEIWTDLTIASLFMQVDYVWQSGLFQNRDDALEICSLVSDELDMVQKEAELTKKLGYAGNEVLPDNSFRLYHSDIEIGNNTIFVQLGENRVLYLTHNTLNKIVTLNSEFIDATDRWINNLVRKSNLISGVSEKQRFQFFHRMKLQLGILEKRIRDNVSTPISTALIEK